MTTSSEALRQAKADVGSEIFRVELRRGANHDPGDGIWLAVLMEEVGEVGRALNETWPQPLTSQDERAIYVELAQVAAVAIRWMMRLIDREEKRDEAESPA